MADWKERLGMVYSTNPDFEYNYDEKVEEATLPPAQQDLRVWRDSKGRGGKVVTIVRGFMGTSDDLAELGRMLKRGCGVGGSAKDGDHRDRITALLLNAGYKCKKV